MDINPDIPEVMSLAQNNRVAEAEPKCGDRTGFETVFSHKHKYKDYIRLRFIG